MAVRALQINMTAADGRPIAELQRLLEMRVQYIKGETTSSAVTATAINILKSVRAGTRRADPKRANIGYTLAVRNDLVPGYSSKQRNGRVIRIRGGHTLEGVKVVNVAGKYVKGEVVKCYIAIVRYGKLSTDLKQSRRFDRYYIIARSEKDAAEFMTKRIRDSIERFAGMAKWVVGQAMRQVSAKMNAKGSPSVEDIRTVAKRVGLSNLRVDCVNQGYGEGYASVHVLDNLDYAMDALRGGSGELNTIYMKAANRTASIINHWVNHMGPNFTSPGAIEAPFPEVMSR